MEQRVSFITLGVRNLSTSRKFYSELGWKESSKSNDSVAFYQAGGLIFALFGWNELAHDAGVSHEGSGFQGVALAYNVRNKDDVSRMLNDASIAGAKIVKPAQETFWGGYNGYFADPDGHLWEVAFNPKARMAEDGSIYLE